MFDRIWSTLVDLANESGFMGFVNGQWKNLIMIAIGCLLVYLAVKKQYEPLLLLPIAFGVILANIPGAGLMEDGGLLFYLYKGVKLGIYPPLIFLGSVQ